MKPECTSCGACCVADHGQNVLANVTPKDEQRLPPKFRLKVVQPDPLSMATAMLFGTQTTPALATKTRKQRAGPYKGVEVTTCTALGGNILHQVSCQVYDQRPSICRTVIKPGDRHCLAFRKMFQEGTRK